MPVMPSPTYHKYDVTDYCGVDEEYGTTEDFRRLAEDCRERNIRLIIDMPMNHTSSEHPWFQAACEYLAGLETGEEIDEEACPYAGYYHFSREQENETYHPVPGTEWYYEGVFWSGMPDLNLEKEAVRRELEKAASFWIELGADGFRMDAALHYEENNTPLTRRCCAGCTITACSRIRTFIWCRRSGREKRPSRIIAEAARRPCSI